MPRVELISCRLCNCPYLENEGDACWDCMPSRAPAGYWEKLASEGIVPKFSSDRDLGRRETPDLIRAATCPSCRLRSDGLTAHADYCEQSFSDEPFDYVALAHGELPRPTLRWNKRGESVVNGTVLPARVLNAHT